MVSTVPADFCLRPTDVLHPELGCKLSNGIDPNTFLGEQLPDGSRVLESTINDRTWTPISGG